jgi:hypothetical protein
MWLKPGGYLEVTGPGSGAGLSDTLTCFHCNSVVEVNAKQRPEDAGGLCYVCMKLICPRCVGNGCTPFEKKLEAWEARGRLLRDMGFAE